MKSKPVMTKNCIAPWQMLEVAVDGVIRPCCGAVVGDFGNINSCMPESAKFTEIFCNDAYKKLRNDLLTGNLQDGCVNCRIAPEAKIQTYTLHQNVEKYLNSHGRTISEITDLCSEFAFEICNTNFTNKCNLSCIYCFTHSNDKPGDGMRDYQEIDHERFIKLTSLLVEKGLKRLHICGVGELTTHPSWRELCTALYKSYPNLFISLVSNFGKKFTDADIEVLIRFGEITISCDTLDPDLFKWLRRGGKVEVLLENIARLKSRIDTTVGRRPYLIINVTESNVIVNTLPDLAEFAVENGIGLQFSNLVIINGSYAEKNKCLTKIVDIPDDQILSAWEILFDLPARMATINPKSYLGFGPLYEVVKHRAEAITLNRFVPSADELFYKSFAVSNPKNPHAILRKIFRSFSDCHRGILISLIDSAVTIDLPYEKGRLISRAVWCGDKLSNIWVESKVETLIGKSLSINTKTTNGYHKYVLLEVFGYEPAERTSEIVETLLLTEPRYDALRFPPEHLKALHHYEQGLLAMQQGDIKRSRYHLEKSIRLQPANTDFQKKLAELLSTGFGQFKESFSLYSDLLTKIPNDIEVWKGIAYISLRIGQTTEARYLLEQILTIQPGDNDALETLRMIKESEQNEVFNN